MIISFLYMLMLLPHLGGVELDSFRFPWFLGAFFVAISWMPLWALYRRFNRDSIFPVVMLSFAPLALFGVFFSVLFANA
ncbi:hypothetical protein ABIC35_000978 [Sphingomonas trueperi]